MSQFIHIMSFSGAFYTCFYDKNIKQFGNSHHKFHCIVLMNVLHEVNVLEWSETFIEIYNLLDDGGFLLIFEVHFLLHGEQPWGDNGYLLLGEEQIQQLFLSDTISNVSFNERDKTSFFVIPKESLAKVTPQSIYNAIIALLYLPSLLFQKHP